MPNRREPSVRCITMNINHNGHARCYGSSNCCRPKNISIAPRIPTYVVAIRCKGSSCWPMSEDSYAYGNRCWSMAAATWSWPGLATIAATVAIPHHTVAASMNIVSPVACIRISDLCWSKCCRRTTHRNISTPVLWTTLSCAWSSVALTHILSSMRTSTAMRRPNTVMAPLKRTSRSARWLPGVARVSHWLAGWLAKIVCNLCVMSECSAA